VKKEAFMKNVRLPAVFAAGLVTALGVGVALSAESQTSQQGFRAGFGVLNGGNEIGDDGQRNAGDRNGRGAFSGIFDGDRLCYGISVANIGEPIAAHIHKAARGENGDIVVTLKHPRKGDPGASSKCTNVDAAIADDIRSNPKGFYVNVHTARFPGGAVRGQIVNGGG
jgi:hypothetical protein